MVDSEIPQFLSQLIYDLQDTLRRFKGGTVAPTLERPIIKGGKYRLRNFREFGEEKMLQEIFAFDGHKKWFGAKLFLCL